MSPILGPFLVLHEYYAIKIPLIQACDSHLWSLYKAMQVKQKH